MNNEDIIDHLLSEDIDGYLARDGDFDNEVVGLIECIEAEGGEGEGDHPHTVIYLPRFNLYLRSNGHYSSGYGFSDWDRWRVVTPQEKTITVYE